MYWGYFPKAAPRPKAKPGKERKKFGETWWGRKWVEVLSKYEYDERMSRGRAYARAEMVKNFKIGEGSITAKVKGSMGVYSISIRFKKAARKEWDAIIQKLGKTPIILGRLLNNELPEEIGSMTGSEFIPSSFQSECSCPDYANPCKHIAAVFYTLADEIDYDPMILFKLKGMGKEQFLGRLGIMETPGESHVESPVETPAKAGGAKGKGRKKSRKKSRRKPKKQRLK